MAVSHCNRSRVSAFFAPEQRVWRGRASLAVVFWGYGVGVSLVLATLQATAIFTGELLFQQFLIAVSALYTVWIVIAIWRCARNADPFWGTLARCLTVTWALNAGLVLFFLQIELVLRYVRG
ncbi:hypothetical protein [Oceaniglobus indicus]|uniref:hypothetical protein n=1 Tax=Oceaniglobus indicus TaxID=2047749 RepID=UPI000C17E6B5|nr:hypothetical protein [Oceaniglobus indicus]